MSTRCVAISCLCFSDCSLTLRPERFPSQCPTALFLRFSATPSLDDSSYAVVEYCSRRSIHTAARNLADLFSFQTCCIKTRWGRSLSANVSCQLTTSTRYLRAQRMQYLWRNAQADLLHHSLLLAPSTLLGFRLAYNQGLLYSAQLCQHLLRIIP